MAGDAVRLKEWMNRGFELAIKVRNGWVRRKRNARKGS